MFSTHSFIVIFNRKDSSAAVVAILNDDAGRLLRIFTCCRIDLQNVLLEKCLLWRPISVWVGGRGGKRRGGVNESRHVCEWVNVTHMNDDLWMTSATRHMKDMSNTAINNMSSAALNDTYERHGQHSTHEIGNTGMHDTLCVSCVNACYSDVVNEHMLWINTYHLFIHIWIIHVWVNRCYE